MKRTVVAFILLLSIQACCAFDTETHAVITRAAYGRSELSRVGQGSLLETLGVTRLETSRPFERYWIPVIPSMVDPTPSLNEYYGDPSNVDVRIQPERFERCQMREFLRQQVPVRFQLFGDTVEDQGLLPLLPIQNWLVRGAIREDDLGWTKSLFAPSTHCSWELLGSAQGFHPRSLNHFYDPYSDKGLNPCLSGETCRRSIDWALGSLDSLLPHPTIDPNRENHFTYADAREAMWGAVTREYWKDPRHFPGNRPYTADLRKDDSWDRMALWATTFRALGNVVHLLQDAAQPQHTRNDPHTMVVNSLEQQAFESYTNDRILGVTSDTNAYVRGFFVTLPNAFTAPDLGDYPGPNLPPVTFSSPVRFFTTRNDDLAHPATWAGLADFSNRGFFSGGTLDSWTFDDNVLKFLPDGHPSPPHSLSEQEGYTEVRVPCPGLGDDPRLRAVTCKHYTHAVPDVVSPAYANSLPIRFAGTKAPLASESVFLGMMGGVTTSNDFVALSIDELDTIGNLNIARAVSYSAGLINYFFRGRLEVTPPSDGIYAIRNHGDAHSVNAWGYPCVGSGTSDGCSVFGFTKLRLNVRNPLANKNPPDLESGTSHPISYATGLPYPVPLDQDQHYKSRMVAVARYHRNPCYTPTLAGEQSAAMDGVLRGVPNCTNVRTAYQEISVSKEVPVTAGLLDGAAVLETFDFSDDPIPINATDLFVQVAYRGPLGDEDDAIAVGAVDVSEPTYFSDLSMTDLVLRGVNGEWQWVPWATLPTDGSLDMTHLVYCQDGWEVFATTESETLPMNHVIRFAMLRDFSVHEVIAQATAHGEFAGPTSIGRAQTVSDARQATDEIGHGYATTLDQNPMLFGRGIVLGSSSATNRNGDNSFDFLLWECAQCSTVPSPWAQSPIVPPPGGFVSEHIGHAYLPGEVTCPIALNGQAAASAKRWTPPAMLSGSSGAMGHSGR